MHHIMRRRNEHKSAFAERGWLTGFYVLFAIAAILIGLDLGIEFDA